MDVLNLGLSAVLYDTKKGTYYTPNTNKTTNTDDSREITEENQDITENVEGGE